MPKSKIHILVMVPILHSTTIASDPWADTVVDASKSLNGSDLYNDPKSVLGSPTRSFYDPFLGQMAASVVVGVFNLDAPDGNKVITTLNGDEFIKVRFDEPVEDDPENPYGVDLLVFGNSFFYSDTFIQPGPDMETVRLLREGGLYSEPVTIAVSQTGKGDPRSKPHQWYVYDQGPFADDLFPTNAFVWDRCEHDWGIALNFTKPVDPALTIDDFLGHTAADAIDMYGASGGGAGFDLSESGFRWIRYVYLTSKGGEVDALADVSPGWVAPGDIDIDGDVDLGDVAWFQGCYTGTNRGPVVCKCKRADLDEDDDVDLDDFRLLAVELTGPR